MTLRCLVLAALLGASGLALAQTPDTVTDFTWKRPLPAPGDGPLVASSVAVDCVAGSSAHAERVQAHLSGARRWF